MITKDRGLFQFKNGNLLYVIYLLPVNLEHLQERYQLNI